MRETKIYLKDMLEAIKSIEKFVKKIDFKTFKKDDLRASAVVRKFEIMGEAAKNVPENVKQKYAYIPWRDIAGMRDKLIHFYFGIKYELVWSTIKTELPKLKIMLKKIIADMENKKL